MPPLSVNVLEPNPSDLLAVEASAPLVTVKSARKNLASSTIVLVSFHVFSAVNPGCSKIIASSSVPRRIFPLVLADSGILPE